MTKLNFVILSSGGRWRERQRAIRCRRRETVRSPSGLKSLFHPALGHFPTTNVRRIAGSRTRGPHDRATSYSPAVDRNDDPRRPARLGYIRLLHAFICDARSGPPRGYCPHHNGARRTPLRPPAPGLRTTEAGFGATASARGAGAGEHAACSRSGGDCLVGAAAKRRKEG